MKSNNIETKADSGTPAKTIPEKLKSDQQLKTLTNSVSPQQPVNESPHKHSHSHHKHKHHHKHHHHHDRDKDSQSPFKHTSNGTSGLDTHALLNGSQEYHVIPQQKGLTLKISGKKRIVNNCGVQVNLRRKTENKGVQVTGVNPSPVKINRGYPYPASACASPYKVNNGYPYPSATTENASPAHVKPGYPYPSGTVEVVGSPVKVNVGYPYPSASSVPNGIPQVSSNGNIADCIKPETVECGTQTTKRSSKLNSTNKNVNNNNIDSHSIPHPHVDNIHNLSSLKQESAQDIDLKTDHFVSSVNSILSNSKYKQYLHLEKYPNGGACVMHVYQQEIDHLSPAEQDELVKDYFDFVYGEETEGVANCVMGIVHGAVANQQDYIDYFAENHSGMTVKAGVLGKSDIETMTMEKYREQMIKSYQEGTFRMGPLLQISLVGTVHEEVGDHFPEFLDILESNPFLRVVMPWAERSVVHMERNLSNDGPILWARPGEQMVPPADMPKSPFKRKR